MKDTGPLSLEARGAWIDLLCAMWHSKNRGVLSYTFAEYGRLLRTSTQKAKKVIFELVDLKICDCFIDGEEFFGQKKDKNLPLFNKNVTLINRRMHNEENNKIYNRLRTAKKRMSQSCHKNVTTHSSSSSSSSKKYIKKIKCEQCKFNSKIDKSFFKCLHPDAKKMSKENAMEKLKIKCSSFQKDEWFQWPDKFNVHWLTNCEGYKKNG